MKEIIKKIKNITFNKTKNTNDNKPKLKVVTTFTGIDMQRRGLENANCFDIEMVATSETDINAIISCASIHNGLTNELIDSYDYPNRNQMAKELTEMNIGYDWNKNKSKDWYKVANSKDSKKQLQKTWLACKLNKNYGDISLINKFPQCDVFTYSSPCTDYSISGKGKGNDCKCLDCGTKYNPLDLNVDQRYNCPNCNSSNIQGTRSGLLAEVERVLINMINDKSAPKILIQENVDGLVNKKFKKDFDKWQQRLEDLGYNNYWVLMNAKYFGVPQNRNRVFQVSIRKDIDNGKFEFPKQFDTGIRLKDILDNNVDEKFFINTPKAQELIDDLIKEGKIE